MDWSEILEREGGLLLDAATLAPDAAVPACPDFDMTKLLRHVDFVLRRIKVGVEGTDSTPFRRDDSLLPPAPAAEVFTAYPVDLAALVAAEVAADPAMATWTMVDPEGTVEFWLRRAAQEVTVHRVDAQQAAGVPVTPVDAEQAADGIDEVLALAAALWDGGTADPESVHLHATDAEGEWLVVFGTNGMLVERNHATGDAAVRGPIADLHLWLWGRAPLDTLEVFGDVLAVTRLREAIATI
jgi:hypothetical protein